MARRQFQDADAGRVAQSSVADDRDRRQDSGTFAWSVRSGHARLNLITGHAAFEVEALAINGAQLSGTPGPENRRSWHLRVQCYGCHPEHTGFGRSIIPRRRRPGVCRVKTMPGNQTSLTYPNKSLRRTQLFLVCKNLNLTRPFEGSRTFYRRPPPLSRNIIRIA
jgi:hypothetical protein